MSLRSLASQHLHNEREAQVKDFTIFYGFVKKMVQKNQYTYNVPPGPSDYIYTTRPEGPSLMWYSHFDFTERKFFCLNMLKMTIFRPFAPPPDPNGRKCEKFEKS